MKSLLIKIPNNTLAQKVIWLLKHFKDDGIEVIQYEISKENKNEKSIDFGTYQIESFANLDGLAYQQKIRLDEWC